MDKEICLYLCAFFKHELEEDFVELTQKRRAAGGETDVVKLLTEIDLGAGKFDDMTIASHLSMLIIGGAETFPKVFANLVPFEKEPRCVWQDPIC